MFGEYSFPGSTAILSNSCFFSLKPYLLSSRRTCGFCVLSARASLDWKSFGDLVRNQNSPVHKQPASGIYHLTYLRQGRSAFEPLAETVTSENGTQALQSIVDDPEEIAAPATDIIPQVDNASYRQQYDRRGYPENSTSRALSRQSRRAINDILTTVGVCVGVDANGHRRAVHDGSIPALDKSKVAGIIRENEMGMLVGFTEAALDDLAGMGTTGLRYRLQVCELQRST